MDNFGDHRGNYIVHGSFPQPLQAPAEGQSRDSTLNNGTEIVVQLSGSDEYAQDPVVRPGTALFHQWERIRRCHCRQISNDGGQECAQPPGRIDRQQEAEDKDGNNDPPRQASPPATKLADAGTAGMPGCRQTGRRT